VTCLNCGNVHGAVSPRGDSAASWVVNAVSDRAPGGIRRRSESGTRRLRNSAAGIPSSRGRMPGRNRRPTYGSASRAVTDAAVSGPATTMRSFIEMRSMHPSGRTCTAAGGPSIAHATSIRPRSVAGGANSR
jgi:hypothetical protein